MNTRSGEEVPKSIVASYNEAFSKNVYRGTLEEWCRLQYMLFRLAVQQQGSDREPASFARWVRSVRELDAQQGEK